MALRYVFIVAVTLFFAVMLVFALNELSPGDAARKILGAYATDTQVAALTAELGLDRPAWIRFGEHVAALLSGDLGMSTRFKAPVSEILADRLGNTALLGGIAFALIVPISLFLGVLAGTREGGKRDRAIVLFGTVITSIPEFALGVFLIVIFVVWLEWLPGTAPLTDGGQWSIAAQMVLPIAVIVLFDCGYVLNMVRASTVKVMRAPYIRTALLKGVPFGRVVTRHALRNALIAPITVILLQLNYLVAGVVVVEALFAFPGFGRMMLEAALAKDTALLEAGALVAVFVAVFTQILSDLCYRLLDPRIAA
jgi:ABC-type dipeptide/oligopeptide/nickel transport systems, permease components